MLAAKITRIKAQAKHKRYKAQAVQILSTRLTHKTLCLEPCILCLIMRILHTDIWKFSIPMHPFTIATGTMHYAQNIFIRVHTDAGLYGVGECSAFPMIAGETQATCFEMAKDFAAIWKNKDATVIEERVQELHNYTAFNATIKS